MTPITQNRLFNMTHQQRFCFIFIFFLCPLSSLFAQSLPFADIVKIYTLDSSGARKFCIDKNWNFADAKHDGAATRYEFETGDSSQTRLEISYPNDSASLNVQLNYWFGDKKEYNNLKKAIRKQGFTRKQTKEIQGALPSYAERYVKDNMQIELIHPEGKQPYWLFLHPVGNYTW